MLSLTSIGCGQHNDTLRFDYTAFDTAQTPVVSGTLYIRADTLDSVPLYTYRLSGRWTLQLLHDSADTGPQVGRGLLNGSIRSNTEGRINLNPNVKDNNVYLMASFEDGIKQNFNGTWQYTTKRGLISQGTFTCTRIDTTNSKSSTH